MSPDKAYKDKSFEHRGSATVAMAGEMLAHVFGQNVYRDVKVIKNKKEVVTDIDVLAIAGNKAVIVQSKSKKLTALARTGNENQLEADFKKAIQEAYGQGVKCRKAILERDNTFST